jgi:hypothetical protein
MSQDSVAGVVTSGLLDESKRIECAIRAAIRAWTFSGALNMRSRRPRSKTAMGRGLHHGVRQTLPVLIWRMTHGSLAPKTWCQRNASARLSCLPVRADSAKSPATHPHWAAGRPQKRVAVPKRCQRFGGYCKSLNSLDGGVAQLVRAAES